MAPSTMYTRVGLILYVQRYTECVVFYRDLLELRILFQTSELTCFEFGNGYLMVELDDQQPPLQRQESHAACLRLNVPNVKQFADALNTLQQAWLSWLKKIVRKSLRLLMASEPQLIIPAIERMARTSADPGAKKSIRIEKIRPIRPPSAPT